MTKPALKLDKQLPATSGQKNVTARVEGFKLVDNGRCIEECVVLDRAILYCTLSGKLYTFGFGV